MKVTINKDDLTLVLEAIAESEHRWREDAYRQHTDDAHEACIQKATELHDIYSSIEVQIPSQPEPTPTQQVDLFEIPWDPDDPRNW